MGNETTTEPQNKTAEDEQPALIDTIYWALPLPEFHGQLIAISSLLEEVLAELQSGLLSSEQINGIFERAAERAKKRTKTLVENPKFTKKEHKEIAARTDETSDTVLERIRERLTSRVRQVE